MLKVYSNRGSGNCYKVRLLLSQVAVPFETIEMDVLAGDQRRPAYLLKNPNGTVPAVEFDDGTCLAESGAILYRFGRDTPLWPDTLDDQTQVLHWMFFEQYSHEPQIAVARFWCHYLKAEAEYAERLREKHEKGYQALDVMEQRLARSEWLAAGRYTLADIALYAYTHVAHQGGFDLGRYPGIRAWIERVAATPRYIPITD